LQPLGVPGLGIEGRGCHQAGDSFALLVVQRAVEELGALQRALDRVLQALRRIGGEVIPAELLVVAQVAGLDVLELLRRQGRDQVGGGG
jgi:hypothetical protein